jgi:hypothetical protein
MNDEHDNAAADREITRGEPGPLRVPATQPKGARARKGNPPVDGGTIARANRALRWHARRAREREQS